MAKTLNQFLEGYLKVKSADEQKFIDKHVTAKTSDRNGNGDDVFKGSTKPIDRRKDRKGYNPGEDEKVYEELKGKQHKIDANKNGKLDAHDFKLLRAKKKVAEAVEELDEISQMMARAARDKAGEEIAGHRKAIEKEWDKNKPNYGKVSDIQQQLQRRKRLTDKVTRKLAKEEAEQIDELSKKTLGSYISKAADDVASKSYEDGYFGAQSGKKVDSRVSNINKAVKKITKEEAEQIDELSKKTLGSYVKKAGTSRTHISNTQKSVDKAIGGVDAAKRYVSDTSNLDKSRKQLKDVSNRLDAKDWNRQQGIHTAVTKLTKEESEQVDEGQKPYVSSDSAGVGRSAAAHVLDSKGKIVKSFHKKEHGADYMKKASEYLHQNYDKMRNEEAEGLDELSNATLGSYERKSGSDRSRDAGNQMAKRKQLGSNRVKVASTEMNKNRPKFEETSYSSKIASVAAKKYGLAERSQKVDTATLAKLRKEEKLANLISDISESQQRTMMTVFEKLNDENKTKFLEACDTPGGVEHMLDFAINNRGE